MGWPIIGLLGEAVKGYFDHRGKKTEAKRQKELRQINADADWEGKQAASSASSWKESRWCWLSSLMLCHTFKLDLQH
jgi:hypothetical protein